MATRVRSLLRGTARPCCSRRRPSRISTRGCWTLRPRIGTPHRLLILLAVLLMLPLISARGLPLPLIIPVRYVAGIHRARSRTGIGVVITVVSRVPSSLRWRALHGRTMGGGHGIRSTLIGDGRDRGARHRLGSSWGRSRPKDVGEGIVPLARRTRFAIARLRSPLCPRIIMIVRHRRGFEIRKACGECPILYPASERRGDDRL